MSVNLCVSLTESISVKMSEWEYELNCESEKGYEYKYCYKCYAGCTLSLSAFGEILERGLHKMRLCEFDSLHSCCALLILACDTRQHPGETRDPLTRTSLTAKKARANEAKYKCWRLHESIQGECFHLHSRSRIVSGSFDESVQPALVWVWVWIWICVWFRFLEIGNFQHLLS